MSPSGTVITREVNPAPGPAVLVPTVFAATSSTFGTVVVSVPLLLVSTTPVAAVTACNGPAGSRPLYSSTRTSGKLAAALKRTVTVLAPAAADTMFGAK